MKMTFLPSGKDYFIKISTGTYKVVFKDSYDIPYDEVEVRNCTHNACAENGLQKGKCLSEAEYAINAEMYYRWTETL